MFNGYRTIRMSLSLNMHLQTCITFFQPFKTLLYTQHLIPLSVPLISITLLVSTKTTEIVVAGITYPLWEQKLCITTCLTCWTTGKLLKRWEQIFEGSWGYFWEALTNPSIQNWKSCSLLSAFYSSTFLHPQIVNACVLFWDLSLKEVFITV